MPSIAAFTPISAILALGFAIFASGPLAAATHEGTVEAGGATSPADSAAASSPSAAAELVPPRVTHHVRAQFPDFHRSGEDDQEMRMIVRVDVDTEGKPGRVEVVDTNLGSSYRRSALQAVSFWRFEPATRNGVPELATILVPVGFGPDGEPGDNQGAGDRTIRAPGATNRVITAPQATR